MDFLALYSRGISSVLPSTIGCIIWTTLNYKMNKAAKFGIKIPHYLQRDTCPTSDKHAINLERVWKCLSLNVSSTPYFVHTIVQQFYLLIILLPAVRFLSIFPSYGTHVLFKYGWPPVLHITVVPYNFPTRQDLYTSWIGLLFCFPFVLWCWSVFLCLPSRHPFPGGSILYDRIFHKSILGTQVLSGLDRQFHGFSNLWMNSSIGPDPSHRLQGLPITANTNSTIGCLYSWIFR